MTPPLRIVDAACLSCQVLVMDDGDSRVIQAVYSRPVAGRMDKKNRLSAVFLLVAQHAPVVAVQRQGVVMHGQNNIALGVNDFQVDVDELAAGGIAANHYSRCAVCFGQFLYFAGQQEFAPVVLYVDVATQFQFLHAEAVLGETGGHLLGNNTAQSGGFFQFVNVDQGGNDQRIGCRYPVAQLG